MPAIVIESFDDESSAKAFFENTVQGRDNVDGIRFIIPLRLESRRNSGDPQDLENADNLHVVLTFPEGTAFVLATKLGESDSDSTN